MNGSRGSRRDFLASAARGAGGAAAAGAVWAYLVRQQTHAAPFALRPPGALPEPDFISTCIKCGQCVADCPYGTLKLADVGAPLPIGTPYFEPRQVPCYMCPRIPCRQACPTGALSDALPGIDDAKMGLAVLIDQENCLSFRGLRCEICYRECPARGRAITVRNRPRGLSKHALFVPVVHSDACTGCGVCEQTCPLPEPAIKVLPTELARAAPAAHYGFDEPMQTPTQAVAPGLDYLNEEIR